MITVLRKGKKDKREDNLRKLFRVNEGKLFKEKIYLTGTGASFIQPNFSISANPPKRTVV